MEERSANIIKEKDLVMVYLDEKRQFLVQAIPRLRISTDHGDLNLSDIVGQPFGFTGKTHLGRDFYCLKPSTADLMMKLRRLTTIVYPKDLGDLLLETAVGPGSRVIEVGTGSGALTLVLAKFLAPDGIVYSYDRRDEFVENARKNLERAGYAGNVEFTCADVTRKGFAEKEVDAVFIDVPEPWTIVPRAFEALKGGHHVVSWSPNVEQVKRTVDELEAHDFKRIQAKEIIEREILVRPQGVRPRERGITHTAYLTRAQKVLVAQQQEPNSKF
ncbi:tRNA (adenine-N1)-methyltransferase [candidate division WOR-3 bacterium]|nr:tRNA (adenine-N1)-methyltransferase [candidate division WOR-3 bacterium]